MMKMTLLQSALLLILSINISTMSAQKIADTNSTLTSRQQSIVAISAITATGELELLKAQLVAGLEAGLSTNEIKEILVQMYAYCGFARSLNGINTFMKVLEERKASGISDIKGREASAVKNNFDKYEQGRKTLQTLTKTNQSKPAAGFGEFAPR